MAPSQNPAYTSRPSHEYTALEIGAGSVSLGNHCTREKKFVSALAEGIL